MESINPRRVALLATGDELVNGDILNSNGQYAAQQFIEAGITPGTHMVVSDNQAELTDAMTYLLKNHDILITIGGLGPTSDDRTRFALSDAIEMPLQFDQHSWDAIVERLTKLSAKVADTNRQQCLFPENATVYPNPNGTANGCYIQIDNKRIFMLPGPPREMRPMFDKHVLPTLANTSLATKQYKHHWLLLGLGESTLASDIDPIAEKLDITVGYRVDSPYIELKVFSESKKSLDAFIKIAMTHIEKFIVSEQKLYASKQLREFIAQGHYDIHLNDQATYGAVACKIMRPKTAPYLSIIPTEVTKKTNRIDIQITGLDTYWQQSSDKINIHICIQHAGHTHEINKSMPNRTQNSIIYITETICWEILIYFRSISA